MKERVIILALALIVAMSVVSPITNAGEIHWSDIHETEVKVSPNIWKAKLNFTFAVDEIDAVAIRLFVNETPPSYNGSVSLKNASGGMIFHKEPVVLTQDELEQGIWHIEYLTPTLTVEKKVNYTFSLRIHKNMELEPETFETGGDLNFRFGFNVALDVGGGGGGVHITLPTDEDEPEQTETDDTTCNMTAIILGVIASLGAIGMVRHEK